MDVFLIDREKIFENLFVLINFLLQFLINSSYSSKKGKHVIVFDFLKEKIK